MESSEEVSVAEESEDGWSNFSQLNTQDMLVTEREGDAVAAQKDADVGVIDRVQLFDFMCHRKLDVKLAPNVNFILGRNGSGKSAIMTAIVVALGGKATATHRASSLKNFIRTGAKSAEVVLTLRNRGIESYKPADYGDTVTVHRTIRDDGTTSYKIKAANGSTVSTKKEDLVHMLDHWNIQVDNPVSLLDQDTSRNFLHSNNPSHKYKLFVKATRLEQIHHDYERAQEDQAIMKKSIERNEMLSEDLKKEAKVLEERLQLFDRLREMEEKMCDLEKELQWAMVMELEKPIRPLEQQLLKERNRIPRNQQNSTTAESKINELDGLYEAVGCELESVVREVQEVSERRVGELREKRKVEKEVRALKMKQSSIRASIEEQTREKTALQQQMDDLVTRSQRDTAGENARRLEEMEVAERQLKELQEDVADFMNKKTNADKAMQSLEDRRKQLEDQCGHFRNELREGERKVQTLQSSRSDQLLAYGQWMPALVKAVQAAHSQFRKPPKGPIGSMLKLHDYSWSVAVEALIGRDISAFVVDNTYDRATLRRIIDDVVKGRGQSPGVLVSRYDGRAYDVSRQRPPTSHPTVLSMMDIADVEVRNALIDQYHIDSVLLIPKRLDAERVIEVERPRGASMAYTIEGDQIMNGRFYAYKRRPLGVIKESVDRAIQEEQSRLRDLESQLYTNERSMKELGKEAGDTKEQMGSVRRNLASRQSQIHGIQMRLKELSTAAEEEESQEDIATYESEIQDCQTKIDEMMEQKREHDSRLSELKAKLNECTASLSTIESETERITSRKEEIKAQHSEYEHERQKAASVLQHYRDRVTEIMDIITNYERKLSDEKKKAETAANEASKVCERVETGRSRKSLETEIAKLKRHIQQEEPQASEKDSVEEEYMGKVELYEKTMETVRAHKYALEELRQGLMLRMKQYGGFQEIITTRACVYFKNFLQSRNYDGNLKFNHENETLTMEVSVDGKSKLSKSTKNTKSLSGGERSFTTVCFIMSLWDVIEAPFRCLDEFDVFMDMMNRRTSMRLMMQTAVDQKGKQFIFFTPQDMSQMGINVGEVKCLKLNPPDRRQTTLD